MDRNGPGGQRNGIGKGGARDIAGQLRVEFYDLGINQFPHARVKHQVHDMQVCQKDLVKQPRDIACESEPHEGKSPVGMNWKKQISGQDSDNATGNDAQNEMESVESSREHQPHGKHDQEG